MHDEPGTSPTGLARRGSEGVPDWLASLGSQLAFAASAVGFERAARITAIAVTPLLLSTDERTEFGLLLVGLTLYVLVTGLSRRNRYLRGADLVVAAAVIVLTGASMTSFLPFLLVAVAGPAVQGGLTAGLAASATLAIVAVFSLLRVGELGARGPGSALTVILVFVLTAVTTALASRLSQDRDVRGRRLLAEANRLLSSLRSIAEEIPGGLDVTTVSTALVAEARAHTGVRAVTVLSSHDRGPRVTAASGVDHRLGPVDAAGLTSGRPRLVPRTSLPERLAGEEGPETWVVMPLRNAGRATGALLVGVDETATGHRLRRQLVPLARDGAVALQNARLFNDTQRHAVDTARQRIASDLHDGVAQALTHLRMELELLARGDETDRDELARLSRVASGALNDLRRTITGLRAPGDSDVGRVIQRHLDDVSSIAGTPVRLWQKRQVVIDPSQAEEVLRITQEAVSNALRHAGAAEVLVMLDGDTEAVVLHVVDNGTGIRQPARETTGTGLGLHTMRERAERLGGELTIEDAVPHGTEVRLTFPPTGPEGRPPSGTASLAEAPGAPAAADTRTVRSPTPAPAPAHEPRSVT